MGQIKDNILLQKIVIVIKKLRSDKGVTQEQVYNETNVHIGRIEAGRANLSVTTLATLCGYFQIKLSEFYLLVEKLD